MDDFVKVFSDPIVVMPLIVSIALMFLQPEILKLRSLLISLVLHSPKFIRNFVLHFRVKHKKKIKNTRWNQDEFLFRIAKANSYKILFFGSVAFYLAMIALGPLKGINTWPDIIQHFIASPLYAFEILWLLEASFVKELLTARAKLRVTNKKKLGSKAGVLKRQML